MADWFETNAPSSGERDWFSQNAPDRNAVATATPGSLAPTDQNLPDEVKSGLEQLRQTPEGAPGYSESLSRPDVQAALDYLRPAPAEPAGSLLGHLERIPQQQGPVRQILGGVSNTVSDVAESLTSPQNLALLPLAPVRGVGRLAGLLFGAQALSDVPEAARETIAPNKTLQERIQAGGRTLTDVLFGVTGAGYGVGADVIIPKIVERARPSLAETIFPEKKASAPETAPAPAEVTAAAADLSAEAAAKAESAAPKPPAEEVNPNAVKERPQPESSVIEHPTPEERGPATETSGGDRPQQSGEIPQEVKPAETPPAPEEKPLSITSIKNEQVDSERVARGLEPATEPARKAFGASWDEATSKIDNDPNYATDLVNQLREKPRALTDVEDAALLHRQVDLQNQFDKTSDAIIKAQEAGDESAVVEHRTRLSQLSDKLLDLYNVGKSAGTETGRGLAARRLLAAEDFSLSKMLTEKRAINDGKPLTPEQEAQIRDFHGQITEAQKSLDDYLAESKLRASEKADTKEAAKLKGAKTRLEGQQHELEQKLAFQDTTKTPRAEPVQLDAEGQALKANVERLKQQFWQNLQADRLAKRTPLEKVQDTFTKWRRAFILSSPVTLAKLTSAAAERMIFTPLEEAVGAGLSKLPGIRQAAERAPLEGPSSLRAEAAAITEGFTKGMRDAVQTIKTGKSDLDVLYGKKNVLPKEAVDFIGTLHGALKTVPKRAEFARAFQKQVEFGLAHGVDVTDPLVQTRYATQAYKQANKSIFMQDNRVVSAYQRAIAALEQPNKTTGRIPVGGKIGATVAKTLLPIVRVPTNIVAETMQYALGTVSAPARLVNAFRRGIDTLKPEEADLIMREFKKGSVGAAVMLLGYLNADKIGGYYQPGQKREKDDVKFGGVRIFDRDVPSYLVHNPLLEALQIGATIRRVSDSKLRKKDDETQGVAAGTLAAALGLADEVPFVKESLSLSKLAEPRARSEFTGELAKSVAVPALVQWAAQQMDRDDGDPIKRKAEGILEHIQSGIPGLREQLPEKTDKKKR